MTLFARAAADDDRDFLDVLVKFYRGPDPATDDLLS
jgi:uncharacterized protein (DUF1810 family)